MEVITYYPRFNYIYGSVADAVTSYVKSTLPEFLKIEKNNIIMNKRFYVNKYKIQPKTDIIAERLPSMYISLSHVINDGNTIDGFIPGTFTSTPMNNPLFTALDIYEGYIDNENSCNIKMSMESINCNIEYTISDRSENRIQELMLFWRRYLQGSVHKTFIGTVEIPIPPELWKALCVLHGVEEDIGYAFNILNRHMNALFRVSIKVNPGTKKEDIFLTWEQNILVKTTHTVLPGMDSSEKVGRFARMMRAFFVTVNIPAKIFLITDKLTIPLPLTESQTLESVSSIQASGINIGNEDYSYTHKNILELFAKTDDCKEESTLLILSELEDTRIEGYFNSIDISERPNNFIVTLKVDDVPYENLNVNYETFEITIPALFKEGEDIKVVSISVHIDNIKYTKFLEELDTSNAYFMEQE